jgi:hypothetical protein
MLSSITSMSFKSALDQKLRGSARRASAAFLNAFASSRTRASTCLESTAMERVPAAATGGAKCELGS